jgi:hypothetical protein
VRENLIKYREASGAKTSLILMRLNGSSEARSVNQQSASNEFSPNQLSDFPSSAKMHPTKISDLPAVRQAMSSASEHQLSTSTLLCRHRYQYELSDNELAPQSDGRRSREAAAIPV